MENNAYIIKIEESRLKTTYFFYKKKQENLPEFPHIKPN